MRLSLTMISILPILLLDLAATNNLEAVNAFGKVMLAMMFIGLTVFKLVDWTFFPIDHVPSSSESTYSMFTQCKALLHFFRGIYYSPSQVVVCLRVLIAFSIIFLIQTVMGLRQETVSLVALASSVVVMTPIRNAVALNIYKRAGGVMAGAVIGVVGLIFLIS